MGHNLLDIFGGPSAEGTPLDSSTEASVVA
jgi:hypothetical protein